MSRFAASLLLGLASLLSNQTPSVSPAKPLVFAHVTVIDCSGAAPQPDMTLIISGDRITTLGKSKDVPIPGDAQVVEATGKFLIPGLWDMHVHWYVRQYFPLFVANGVTGVRQMFGNPFVLQWGKELTVGSLIGPRMVVASPIVDGPKPIWPGSMRAVTESEGREAVRAIKKTGYDFVKVYNLLPREAFLGVADEAKKQGLPVAGHVPFFVSAAEASDAGMKSMEHLYGVLTACSSLEAEIMKDLHKQAESLEAARDFSLRRRREEMALDTYDPSKAAALFHRLVANGTWQVPTFTVSRAIANLDDDAFRNDPRMKYMPPGTRESWDPKSDFRLKHLTKEDYAHRRRYFKRELDLAGAMRRAGVEFLAGTDVSNPYCFPGFSLHDELELLVQAGLTPMEALQTATRNPAKFLDRLDDLGTVEKGKLADLVLLDASPLEDIKNTRRIAAVVLAGKLFEKAALQKMLDEIEAGNKK